MEHRWTPHCYWSYGRFEGTSGIWSEFQLVCERLQMRFRDIVGTSVMLVVLGVVFLNGIVMVISPSRWFKLPRSIALRGTLREKEYLRTHARSFEIRVFGLLLAGVSIWIVGGVLGLFRSDGTGLTLSPSMSWWLCLVTCVGTIACGIIMLLRPDWWVAKYLRTDSTQNVEAKLQIAVRILGAPCILVGIYFLLQCA
jgi:hypothetical protein